MKKYKLAKPYINDEMLDYVSEIIKSGMLVQGEENSKFEKSIGNYFKIPHERVSLVSSGTAALHLALMSLGIGSGDKVIVPNFTFPATANVVELVGAECIFVDVSLTDYNIDVNLLQEAIEGIENKTQIKALIIVHEFGAACHMEQIISLARKYNLYVIEDAACAFGTKYEDDYVGILGDIGCFSLHPRKAITTGEGGIVVAKDISIINKINCLKNHGIDIVENHIDFQYPGMNYRLTNFQAALGLKQLEHFDELVEHRTKLQKIYRETLIHPKIHLPDELPGHSWQSFMIWFEKGIDRNRLKNQLYEKGVETNYGAYDISNLSYYKNKYTFNPYVLGNSKLLHENGLCLPLHHEISQEDAKTIADMVISLLENEI